MTCVCGYARADHDLLGRCPLCRCGDPKSSHEPYGEGLGCSCACKSPPAAHGVPGGAMWEGLPCPGRRSKSTDPAKLGPWLMLRLGTYREPDPDPPRRNWYGMSVPLTEAEIAAQAVAGHDESDAAGPPQVPARAPRGPYEIAGGTRNAGAIRLGRLARAKAWQIEPLYWRSGAGAEGCAVRLAGPGAARAVATWKRPPGHIGELTGWGSDSAYVWRAGRTFPSKVPLATVVAMLES